MINISIQIMANAVLGVVICILANIPLVGIIVGAVGGLIGLYFLISLALSILDYLNILK